MTRHVDPDYPDFKYENAVVLELIDLDRYFEQFKDTAIIANDHQIDTDKDREELLERLTKTYVDDVFDEPINGANPLFEKIEPSMWIRPIGKDVKFIHPKFLTIISRLLRKEKFDIIRHLLDPSYKAPTTTPKGIVRAYLEADFPRGFKSFHDNFDAIMEVLIFEQYRKREAKRIALSDRKRGSKRSPLDYVAMLIEKYRDVLFTNHLPIPSRHVFVMEKKGKNKASEVSLMYHAFDAVSTVTSLGDRIKPITPREADRLDYKINYTCMVNFYENYGVKYLKSKPGIFRKNSYGTSTSFNARAVIVSRQGVHKYEEIEISYAIGFKIFELHIAKVFIDRYNSTPIDIFEMRSKFARQFSPKVHKVMDNLLADYWGGNGWSSNLLRHPYLSTLSSQNLNIPPGGIGTDPLDYTIKMSPLILAGPNADFDGDELVLKIHLDKRMADMWQTTQPHYSAIDPNQPLSYSPDLNLPKPVVPQFYRWLGYDKL